MGTPGTIRRILIVKPSSLGDILHLFPALDLLHRHWPQAKIDFLVHPAFAGILDFSPCPIDRRILFRRRELGHITTFLPEFFRLIRKLRQEHYDLVIDFQGLFRSAVFTAFTRCPRIAGFATPREASAKFFYHTRVEVPPGHAVERYVNLAAALTGQTAGKCVRPILPDNPEVRAALREKIGPLPERLVTLLPGARWKSKRFPPELFAQIAEELHEREPGISFAVVGSGSDRDLEEAIADMLPPEIPLLKCCGKTTLPEMMELLRASAAVVSNDSGPVHAAAALGRPVFAFFGPTDPERTGPYGPGCRIYRLNLDCIGCLRRHCPLQSAPPPCHALDAGMVANDILQSLEPRRKEKC